MNDNAFVATSIALELLRLVVLARQDDRDVSPEELKQTLDLAKQRLETAQETLQHEIDLQKAERG